MWTCKILKKIEETFICYNDYIICSTMKHDEKLLYFTTIEYINNSPFLYFQHCVIRR